MANKKEKKQAKDEKVQRRRESRAKRRGSSSSDDDSSRSSTVNGAVTDVTQWDQEIDRPLRGNVDKIVALRETFQNLSDFVGVLSHLKLNAANAADVFRPEIELKAENERLQRTLTEIQKAVETQRIQELEQKCQSLEDNRVKLQQLQQEAEEARQQLDADRHAITIQRQEMKNELEEKKKELRSDFLNQLDKEKRTHLKVLSLSQDSENKLKRLNEKLKADQTEAEKRAKDLGEGNETLMATIRALRSELDKEKSRFSIQSKGIDYYRAEFTKLNRKLEKLVYDFITGPLNDEQIRAVEADGLEEQEIFKFVPTRDSDVARYLWRRGAQACITKQLCDRLWKSYPCDSVPGLADPESLKIVFDTFSQKYASVNPEKESMWRIMTREILESFSTQPASTQNPYEDIVLSISRMLRPIIHPSKTKTFESRLTEIVANATVLWSAAQKDTCRIWVSVNPPNDADGDGQWEAGSLKGIEPVQIQGDISIKHARFLCLFPLVVVMGGSGDEIVCSGQALFSDCVAFALGHHEKQESARLLAEQQRELRYNHRKNSMNSHSTIPAQSRAQDLPGGCPEP
ncbi:hypothetical protein TMatcc_004947 [Talaromyces marneffei ATCC 18224]|uniref:Uncharacterized protein n=1 Tax=Talaromyces marneffei (strain ATCC 18224 / CBS 334.59 / QM 7333) TaxID=441960 RepID=B6Q800_TALMQ|nr:uncharacterized protein EYB26_000135 [Talaromyces marneffei]EEA26763.1 conserved hypothetical protein [Talaromyces marneffei ATCC 18224]QGA12491.1 hypothetical protein EYB26_000135 [Talaromyces marneffei]